MQEYQLNQAEELDTTADDNQDNVQQESNASISEAPEEEEEEAYATVVSPPTPSILLDTLLAQIETLTLLSTLCSSPSSSQNSTLAWIQEYYSTDFSPKLTHLSTLAARQPEARLATAKFQTALADASYRNSLIDLQTYAREVDDAFSGIDLRLDPRGLCDRADAEFAFCLSVRQVTTADQPNSTLEDPVLNDELIKLLDDHASQAFELYTSATRLPYSSGSPNGLNLPQIHLRRGDCELFRWSVSSAQNEGNGEDGDEAMEVDSPANTNDSKESLLSNAALCYRMAGRAAASPSSATATASGSGAGKVLVVGVAEEDVREEGKDAYVKGLIVEMLSVPAAGAPGGWSEETWRDVREAVGEMKDEGILGKEALGLL